MSACAICLEPMDPTDPCHTICMPVCMHKLHTRCALAAAQYDVRCPICRTQDPSIEAKRDREDRQMRDLQAHVAAHDLVARRYHRKKLNAIRKSTPLRKLRDKIVVEARAYARHEKDLDREWSAVQREQWMLNENIAKLKAERRKKLRRLQTLHKRLTERVVSEIGEQPQFFIDANAFLM